MQHTINTLTIVTEEGSVPVTRRAKILTKNNVEPLSIFPDSLEFSNGRLLSVYRDVVRPSYDRRHFVRPKRKRKGR